MQYKKVCTGKVRETFPGGVHRIPPTLLDRLNEIGTRVHPEDKHYRFLLVLTLKFLFAKENLSLSGPKLSYEVRHFPVSVSIASCIPGKKDLVSFVSERDK